MIRRSHNRGKPGTWLARELRRLLPYVLLPLLVILAWYWSLNQRIAGVDAARDLLIPALREQDARLHDLRGLEEIREQLILRMKLIEVLRQDSQEVIRLFNHLGNLPPEIRLVGVTYGRSNDRPRAPRQLVLQGVAADAAALAALDRALQEGLGILPAVEGGERPPGAEGDFMRAYSLEIQQEHEEP